MPTTTFKRDRVFWLISLQTGVYGIFMGGFGPALPLLQEYQGTSAAVAGLHGTALGLASILAGYLNAPLVHKFGRYKSAWIGLLIFNIGALCFVIFPTPNLTIPAMGIAGIGITIAINNTITYLTGHFPNNQTQAISQNNAVNQGFFLLGTFIVGAIATTTFNWRISLLLCVPFSILLYLLAGRKFKPEHIPSESGRERGPLSGRYWLSWVALLFTIATEFAIQFWAAALIKERTGLESALATLMVLAFPLGMFAGRWYGPYIAPALRTDTRLKALLLLQGGGFVIFWISSSVPLSFLAVFLMGLGTSMQFTLGTLRLLHFGRPKTDLAMGLSSWAAGIAIAGSPFILGSFADSYGIATAYLIVPIFIGIAFAIVAAVQMKEERV